MAKIVYIQMPSIGSYPNQSPPPGQKLGCKSPRVGADFWCKSSGVRGGEGWLWMKLIPALNCQMRNLGENQNLFQILFIKVKRDVFFFPFNKNYFHNPKTQFFIQKIFKGYDFGIL